jgi:hypothetical protein
MTIETEVPEYSRDHGLQMKWENGAINEARIQGNSTVIRANKPGLISLARLLLTLVNDEVPKGHHWHLDESNALEEGSQELIIEKR